MFSKITREDRQFLFSWSLLTGAGSMAGFMAISIALGQVELLASNQGDGSGALPLPLLIATLLVYGIPGAIIGFGQWFELRNMLPRAGWWVIATSAGWILGFGLGNLAFANLTGLPDLLRLILPLLAIGLCTGIGQWLFLRLHWDNSLPWVLAAILVSLIGGFGWLIAGSLGGAFGWVIAGAISGYALIFLRDRSLLY